MSRDLATLLRVVGRVVPIKARVVERDERRPSFAAC